MKRIKILIASTLFITLPYQSKADMWGGDLPLLMEIVTNTLNTMLELQKQNRQLQDQLRGINDRINRVRTISKLVEPSTWKEWKNPKEALRRLQLIYHTMPKEYRSPKADAIEAELSRAMNLISVISAEVETTFQSGKELERIGKDSSPGVAQKLTASGVGTLVSMEAQSQKIQSHITSLLAQMLADGNEKESRLVVSQGKSYRNLSSDLGTNDGRFSERVNPMRMRQ